MITERDLQEAIAECQGKRNPCADDCIKLAAFYTIKDHLFPGPQPEQFTYSASYSTPPAASVDCRGDGEFARIVDGRRQEDVWPVMVELMETLAAINPRLYDAVMRKLQ